MVLTAGAVGRYNKLFDMFESHQLFYIIGSFYTCLFTVIGVMLMSPKYGIYNIEVSRLIFWSGDVSSDGKSSCVVRRTPVLDVKYWLSESFA